MLPEKITITLHQCQVCGDHAREISEPAVRRTGWRGKKPIYERTYEELHLKLSRCQECGLLVCTSCMADNFCCERAAEDVKTTGQLALFAGPEKE